MSGWELGLATAGVVFQVLGLAAVAAGVGKTWAENAEAGDSLVERIAGPPIRFVWRKVFRQASHAVVHRGSADGVVLAEGEASGVVTRGLAADASPADQLSQVKAEVDAAWLKAHSAQAVGERALKGIERLQLYVDKQDVAVQDGLKSQMRKQAADGVPLAVVGLAATGVGTLLQYLGAFFG
jgi:hypothetical protein